VTLITALLLFVGLAPARAQQLASLSRDENALVFIDLTQGKEVRRIGVGLMCHELAVDGQRRHAFTASYRGNTVHTIDLEGEMADASRSFVLNGFQRLHGVSIDSAGDAVFVTSEDPSAVLEFDPTNGNLRRMWSVPGLHAHFVTLAPGEKKLYVGSELPGAVSIIDRETDSVKTVLTGEFVVDIRIDPDRSFVWVAIRNEGKIAVIDIQTDEVVEIFDSGGDSPAKLRFRPNSDEVWISNHLGETVTVLDRKTHEVIDNIHVGERPLALAFNDDGSLVYVSRTRASEIVEIDANTREILRRIPVGGNPDGMVWLP